MNQGALMILSSMITPAILILATSSLIQATSSRLSRILERVRHLADLLRERPAPPAKDSYLNQLEHNVARVRSLQRTMTRLYLALGCFILTSVTIGVTAISGFEPALVYAPLVTAFFGFFGLMEAGVRLILESRKAVEVVDEEMASVRRSIA